MLTVLTANSQAGGFTIANSLRFRASASAYLSRTPSVAGNQQKFTWSGWLKKGAITVAENIFTAGATSSNRFHIGYDASVASGGNGDYLCCFVVLSGVVTNIFQTSALFRDPSSWYHIVLAVDTTQATATNRIALYVNGAQQTFSTYNAPAQNANLIVNSAVAHAIGTYSVSPTIASVLFDGYMGEINFIDGQALTPSSFGEIDSTTGVWKAKRYTGTYGTNGFKLNFSNGTSTTTLGYDSSGNGNNWTTNNISLTSGVTYDSMWDSPTSYDDGNNGVGNYCTWNPLSGTSGTTANGNLYFYGPGSYASRIGTLALPTSGKWYYEVTITVAPYTPRGSTTAYNWIGVAYTINFNVSTTPGVTNVNGVMLGDNGYINNFASASSDAGITFALNDVIGIAVDTGANTYAFYKNGSSVASGTINMTAGTSLSPMHLSYDASNGAMQANFGQRPFAYTPPSGYKSLCTQNLPVVTIQNGAQYMAATLYTGTGSSVSISNAVNGVGFQPDLVWGKLRTTSSYHRLSDSVRGASLTLATNVTDAEVSGNGLVSFDASGFSMNSSTNINQVYPYVAWQWKAGGTAVTNTAGSITSSVSANPTAGFSVATFTMTGVAGATVGHGLGIAPKFVIIKSRNLAQGWIVYHDALGVNGYLWLEQTSAAGSGATVWNSTAPSSSVITFGSAFTVAGWGNVVAYCFAAIPGYSAFGSYTGNGSADGPFVYCGFRPRYLMVKRTDSTGAWEIYDTSRSPYNVTGAKDLQADSASAEGASGISLGYDILSNGFKNRDTTSYLNASGGTYIYACFAESPFQLSLAR